MCAMAGTRTPGAIVSKGKVQYVRLGQLFNVYNIRSRDDFYSAERILETRSSLRETSQRYFKSRPVEILILFRLVFDMGGSRALFRRSALIFP